LKADNPDGEHWQYYRLQAERLIENLKLAMDSDPGASRDTREAMDGDDLAAPPLPPEQGGNTEGSFNGERMELD
jgi:hypothetical protein